MRKVFIEHITRYNYSNSVRYHANQVMLYPISNEFQKVNSHKLEVTSFPTISTYEDFFGNTIGTFNIIAPHNQMTVKSLVEITMMPKIKILTLKMPKIKIKPFGTPALQTLQ